MAGAWEIPGFSFTLPADTDMSATQYLAVDVNSTGEAIVPTGAGDRIVGIRQNKPVAGEAATIVHSGISLWTAGGVVTTGDLVSTDAAGKAKTAASTDLKQGIALQTSANDGELIAVLLTPGPAAV